jgi:hypothetical protein
MFNEGIGYESIGLTNRVRKSRIMARHRVLEVRSAGLMGADEDDIRALRVCNAHGRVGGNGRTGCS